MTDEKHPSTRDCLTDLIKVQAETKTRLDSHIAIYNRDQKAYISTQLMEHQDHKEINTSLAEIKTAVSRTKDKAVNWVVGGLSFLLIAMTGTAVGLVVYIVKTLHPT